MNIYYALPENILTDFIKAKDELQEVKKGLSPVEIKEGIEEIYKAAEVFSLDENGQPSSGDFYTLDDNGIAHIPVVGVLVPEANPCAAFFGKAETEYRFIREAIKAAEADERVSEIIFDINSPGGHVDGVDITGRAIKAIQKPKSAYITNMAASAAYWLATQTGYIKTSAPTDYVGSIGVVVEQIDRTEAEKAQGITRRVLTSSSAPAKVLDPATEEGREKIIEKLNETHLIFATRVAEARGTTVENVNKSYGQGSLVIAEKALQAGMIDEVEGAIFTKPNKSKSLNAGVSGKEKTAAEGGEITQEVKGMTLEELKKDHSAVYAEAVQEGVSKGIAQEKARVAELDAYIEADPENLKVAEVVKDAKATGKTVADINAKLQVAIRDGGKLSGENPPDVKTDLSGKDGDPVKQAKADLEILKKAGL